MSLVLHPHIASPGRVRVWAGAFERTAAPALTWTADGNAAVPAVIRAMTSVRSPQLLTGPTVARVWSGVYEFDLGAGVHDITCNAGADTTTLRTRTLPASLDQLDHPSGSFRVMLASCFHRDQDREGLAAATSRRMTGVGGADLAVLMGDQVYLDMPAWKDFPSGAVPLAERFERDYTANWLDTRYNPVLDAAPTAFCPDDHEYWNNFPAKSPIIQNSWTAAGRKAWTEAAYAMYVGFQVGRPAPTSLQQFDVPPLSFMIADTRSWRSSLTNLLPPGGLAAITTWVDTVNAQRWHGIFVTGQSLWAEPSGQFSGSIGDYELSNFSQYDALLKQLLRLERDAIWITGDVHYGRFLESRDSVDSRAIFEIISSPASLVWDGMPRFIDRIRSVVSSNPWPLHSDPGRPPAELAKGVVAPRTIRLQPGWVGQRGNQLALLAMNKMGDHVEARLEFWSARASSFQADRVVSFSLH